MGVYIPYTRLPSAYQEVEYIKSSGTQYFVIGTSFKTSYKSVIDFQMTQTGGDQVVIGFNFSPYRYGINAYASKFKVITGNTGGWSDTISEDTNRHTLTIDKSTATVDGNNYTISGYTNVTVNGGIGVFAHNDNGVGNYFASVKIYNLEIYDENGVLIYHLVPCYRKSDNVIGMYDLVNKQFYTNSGTGTFSKGNDVTMSELKNAYIGQEIWKPGANTYIYYPLTSDLKDVMGNGNTGTMNGTCTFDSSTGIHVTGTSGNYVTGMSLGVNNRNTFTLNVWIKLDNITDTGQTIIGYSTNYRSTQARKLEFWTDNPGIDCCAFYGGNNGYVNRPSSIDTNWHNYCLVGDGTKYQWYYDGEPLGSAITASAALNDISELQLGWGGYYGSRRSANGYIKDYIVETVARTAQEISDYYNQTKADYGL